MIIIDDAGIGAIIGVPVIVGSKDGVTKYVQMKDLRGVSATKETFELLKMFGVEKDEEIRICRGKVFAKFCHEAIRLGYTNIIPMKIEGDFQDVAEDTFMESLYALGLDRSVKLQGKEYKQLFEDIMTQLVLHPELMQYVRPHYQVNPGFTSIVHKVNRLVNEFPNLYNALRVGSVQRAKIGEINRFIHNKDCVIKLYKILDTAKFVAVTEDDTPVTNLCTSINELYNEIDRRAALKSYVYKFLLYNNVFRDYISDRPLNEDDLLKIGKNFNIAIKDVSCKIVTETELPIETSLLDRLKQETLSYKGLVRILRGYNGIITDRIYPAIIDYTTHKVSFYTDTDYVTKIPQSNLLVIDVAKLDEETVQSLDLTELREMWRKIYEMYVPSDKEV